MPMSQTGASINRSGFTLIELMVVIVLLSLVSFISLPLLENRSEGNERLMLRRISGIVKQLYNEATLTRDEHLLTVDFSRNSLSAFRLRSKSELIEKEPFGKEIRLEPLQIKQVDIEGKGTFQTGMVSIRVFPLGWVEQARLSFDKESGGEVTLEFSPLTGSVIVDVKDTSMQ